MELDEALDRVRDQQSFLHFVRCLLVDREDEVAKEEASPSSPYGPGANGWENDSIEQFLGAAIAWVDATRFGISQGLKADNPWKQFAVFLYCGKIHE